MDVHALPPFTHGLGFRPADPFLSSLISKNSSFAEDLSHPTTLSPVTLPYDTSQWSQHCNGNQHPASPKPFPISTDLIANENVGDLQTMGHRAPILTEALIDGSVPSAEGQMPTNMDFLPDMFPPQTPYTRAPTLRNSLIDGAPLIYQHPTENMASLSSTSETTLQRAPTLNDSLIDGAMAHLGSHLATTHNEISSTEQDPLVHSMMHNPSSSVTRGNGQAGDTSTPLKSICDQHGLRGRLAVMAHVMESDAMEANDLCPTNCIYDIDRPSAFNTYY